jgi:tetratricopeptide (TPR) repeat protein
MKVFKVMFVALVVLWSASVHADEEAAAKLIQEAHKHDNMYTLGPSASQQEALKHYQSALDAEPDDKQRLHILYRMGQLYGTCYQLEKGEKPDFRKAIELYKRIIDSYLPEEPLVHKSMISIGDHYTALWELEKALEWHKKVLEYDAGLMAEELNTLKNKEMPSIAFSPDGSRSEPLTKEQLLELQND